MDYADIPIDSHYSSLEDRIHSMASLTAMQGNLEIEALSRCLDQSLFIITQGDNIKSGSGKRLKCHNPPL